MRKVTIGFLGLFFLSFFLVDLSLSQEILYEEHFTGGNASLTWLAGFGGDTLKPYQMVDNPSGDGWVGKLNNQTSGGGVSLSFAGTPDLADYSLEAWVYCTVGVTEYHGIQMRIDSSANSGYQLVTDFDADRRLRFRYAVGAMPTVIHDFTEAEIPGGVPAEAGWHKMKIKAVGNQFWLYWDDQELSGCPYTDDSAASGFFGFYVWNMMMETDTFCDDIIVRSETSTRVERRENLISTKPEHFTLRQNYPNPFNPETFISYQITTNGFADLTIYDLLGRKIRTLVAGTQLPGYYTVTWDGKDEYGYKVPSGTYLYTLKTNSSIETKKMLLMK